MQGWIKDYRKELLSDIWKMPPLYHRVWQYLKYRVNHKPKHLPTPNGETIFIDKGETITSLRQIAENVAWVENKSLRVPTAETIRKILDWLVKNQMIVRTSDTRGTRIKIVNYEFYQGSDSEPVDTKKTPNRHAFATNNNDNNILVSTSTNANAHPVPNNQQIIADLVSAYREINNIKHTHGDYPFIGRLYNQYGYDKVLEGINKLGYKVESGFMPNRPLIYLAGIIRREVEGKDKPQESTGSCWDKPVTRAKPEPEPMPEEEFQKYYDAILGGK